MMFRKIENLAWFVLVTSFLTCIALAVGIPTGIHWYVLNSTRPMVTMLEPRGGTITYQAAGDDATVIVEDVTELKPKARIQLADDADALLLYYHPDDLNTPVGTLQLYGTTDLLLGDARTPRFSTSPLPHRMRLRVVHAVNMRITVAGNGRNAEFELDTPQESVLLQPGSFALTVGKDQTELAVSVGRAVVTDPASGDKLALVPLQRMRITETGIDEIYVGERDLMRNRNGGFEEPLEDFWTVYADAAFAEEDKGEVRRAQIGDDQHLVFFTRVGQGHAETGIRQVLNQDIREVRSLRVRARIRIDAQTLPVCGSLGTECPIMIRMHYLDQESNTVREWLQGFYVLEGENRPFCQSCEWKAQHIKVPGFDVWYDYESPDLLPLLAAQGFTPAAIVSVEVYASGWTYGSAIDEIAILVAE